jgi:hypothetical protein
MKKKQKTKAERPYSVDKLMRNIASCLARDFRSTLNGLPPAVNVVQIHEHGTIGEIRSVDWHLGTMTDPYDFKRVYQLSSLFKRYRFEKDLLSSKELEEAAEKQFLENQDRLRDIRLDALPCYMKNILSYARGYCHKILGNYDLEEHLSLCRFGRKASVGVPMRKACEAERWEVPISGSVEQIVWFSRVALQEDDQAREYVFGQADGETPLFRPVNTLALTFVPKTFKSLRSIMPNTTIGTFYSDGLGKVIQQRLKAARYDITKLQAVHGDLARLGSLTGELVTADQSLASDNITLELVKAIVPDRWFEALNLGRIDKVELPSGTCVDTLTFCTMGIGFTFPLQTLIFLCLLKALDQVYTSGRSLVSVYGDDMIYSTNLHPFVQMAFRNLGLKINVDKTYADGCFRESCGSDYYAGVDVRPFLPKNERGSFVDKKNYELILYNYINGLKRRWYVEECPLTFDYLLTEASEVARGLLRVPMDYPDESGVKCDSPHDTLGIAYRLSPIKFGKHGQVFFNYLRFQPDLIEETRHAPYLWRQLGASRGGDEFIHRPHVGSVSGVAGSSRILRYIEGTTGVSSSTREIFTDVPDQRATSPRKKRGKRFPGGRSCIPRPGGAGRVLRQTGVTVHWAPKF